MKITVYTITDCEFSKQEKEYLKSHQLAFEEKNLETNKDFLTEMLAVSNNFAGTPVTKIEKDDGKIEVLKGFTKEEFDKTLGFGPAPQQPAQPAPASASSPTQTQPSVQPPPQQPDQPTQPQPTPSQPQQPANQPASNPPPANDPLNSILADLQAKSVASNLNSQTDSNRPADSARPTPTDSTKQVPSVPDFPAKT